MILLLFTGASGSASGDVGWHQVSMLRQPTPSVVLRAVTLVRSGMAIVWPTPSAVIR